jgi:hypothetical protein
MSSGRNSANSQGLGREGRIGLSGTIKYRPKRTGYAVSVVVRPVNAQTALGIWVIVGVDDGHCCARTTRSTGEGPDMRLARYGQLPMPAMSGPLQLSWR